jgi:hypothetical protein
MANQQSPHRSERPHISHIAPRAFLQLPRELRDMIYSHLLISIYTPYVPARRATMRRAYNHPRRLNIILTCRTVYNEASEILYNDATFRFPIGGSTGDALALPPTIDSRIQKVELRWRLGDRSSLDQCWCAWSRLCDDRPDSNCHTCGILSDLSDPLSRRQSCTIRLVPDIDCNLATIDRLIDDIKSIKGFRTLTLKYSTQPRIYSGRWKIQNKEPREYFMEKLESTFGTPVLSRNLVIQSLAFEVRECRGVFC